MFLAIPGDVLQNYTSEEAAGVPVGTVAYDPYYKAKFIFLKNNGAGAIAEKLVALALGTNKSSYFCALAAATVSLMGFAGVRVAGANSLAAGEFGWFQISGKATFVASSDSVTVDQYVNTSNIAAGQIETMPATVAGLQAKIGQAVASATSEDVSVMIDSNVWGV